MNLEKKIINRLKQFEKYVVEIQENDTKLIGKAPHIAPKAFLHTIYKGLSEKNINKLKNNLKTKIPKDYKDFLKFSNGLHIFNTTFCLDGFRKSNNRTTENRLPFCILTTNHYERPSNSKKEYFFIGGYDWDGSHLYINKKTNKVHRCAEDNAESLNEWENLNVMIISEIDRLIDLHNENGTEKDENISKTP